MEHKRDRQKALDELDQSVTTVGLWSFKRSIQYSVSWLGQLPSWMACLQSVFDSISAIVGISLRTNSAKLPLELGLWYLVVIARMQSIESNLVSMVSSFVCVLVLRFGIDAN